MRTIGRGAVGRAAVAALVGVVLVATGCGSKSSSTTGASGTAGGPSGKVALLLPENKTARYESQDRPLFTARLKSLCPGCDLLYSNADQDANKQLSQADAALTNGAKVLVVDPVDASAAAGIVQKAKARGVGVISYDRLIANADVDYYISFDNIRVGQLQGQALVDRLMQLGTIDKGQIVMINGSPTDSNAKPFKQGAHSAIDGKVRVGKEYDTKEWLAPEAQREMDESITALGKNSIVGVYAANDPMAAGAIAALKAAGFDPLPPVTGQDAELAGIQRILDGEQYMTVYKAVKPEAERAAELAISLLGGNSTPPTTTGTMNNGKKDVPSIILTPVAVTKSSIKDTVVKDGFWSTTQICTAQYVNACKAAGLL